MKPEVYPLIFASVTSLLVGVSDLKHGRAGSGGFAVWVSGWLLSCAWWLS